MPRRISERGLRLLLALAIASPLLPVSGHVTPARAQQAEDPGGGVAAHLEASLRATKVHGDVAGLLGGVALLSLTPRLAIGGGGAILMSDRPLEGDVVFPDRRLGFGYGGVVVEVDSISIGDAPPLAMRLLVGAGNTDIRDGLTGTRLGSDNVFVVEPEVRLGRRLSRRVSVTLGVSYRATWGLDDLGDVVSGDLRSLAFGLSLRVGPL